MLPGDLDAAVSDMCQACERGNLERVSQLLAWGVGPNTEVAGRSLLARAAAAGNHVVVKRLLRAGARPTMVALIAAVNAGNRHAVEHIADHLVFSGKDPAAYTWGMILGHRDFLAGLTPDLARWVVAQNIDLEETDAYGRTVLELAKMWARPEVVEILAEGLG